MRLITLALLVLIRFYRLALSPYFGSQCRFTPSCSVYAAEAISRYGAAKGSWLSAKRILRCNHWHAGGHDPVP